MPGRYNVIDNNRIHDVSPNPSMDKDYAFGIYLDGGTENTTVTNNVIHDIHSTKVSGTYPINIKKLNHTVSNNIFIAESGGAPRGTIMIQQGGGGELDSTGYGGHVLTNNILFARGLQANAWFYRFHESEFDCSLVHTSDYNIFYKSVTGPKVFYGITGDDNYTQWKTICSSKYDDHSNDSDPLFRGPGSDNYNLEPGSPAYARGFVEIDQNLPGLDDANYIIVDNFAATLDSVNGQIEMDWDAVSGASGYKVKRSTTSGASYGTIASKEVGVFFVTQGPIVFSDGFESGDFSNWTSNASWDISSIQKKNGSYSGRADADSGTLSKSIDTSSYSTMTISFWYRDHLVDDGDQAFFRLYDGANYDSIFEVGITSPEDTWHYYTRTMTNSGPDAQYFHAGFRFRWTCGFVDADEYIWIDDVVLRAQ
jgi:hypothetical protein